MWREMCGKILSECPVLFMDEAWDGVMRFMSLVEICW